MKSYTIFVSISSRQFVSENFENLVNEFCTTITYKKPLSPKIIPLFFLHNFCKNLTYTIQWVWN